MIRKNMRDESCYLGGISSIDTEDSISDVDSRVSKTVSAQNADSGSING